MYAHGMAAVGHCDDAGDIGVIPILFGSCYHVPHGEDPGTRCGDGATSVWGDCNINYPKLGLEPLNKVTRFQLPNSNQAVVRP